MTEKQRIEEAKRLYQTANAAQKCVLEKLFTELRKSENEKIKEDLIEWIEDFPDTIWRGHYKKDVVDWLEKQGQQKPIIDGNLTATNYDKMFQNCNVPKFHEGDWIIYRDEGCTEILRIIGVTGTHYLCNDISDDYCRNLSINFIDNHNYHLWTIKDAKDGDVLLSKHNQPFIYNGIFDEEEVGAYCGIDKFGNDFLEGIFSCNWSYKEGVKPATKKQRDLLFEKMNETGYEWDEDKKELKKIKNEEYNGEDYGIDSLFHAQRILEKTLGKVDGYQTDDGILEHKCAISVVKKLYEKKPGWSEEDEKMVEDIIASIDTLYYHGMVDWLKSLKDRVQPQNRWKPSKEQIIALRWVLNNMPYNNQKEEISGLLDQIKDL